MKFRYVNDDELRAEVLANPDQADTLFEQFIVIRELFKPARVLYHLCANSTDWIEVRPEAVGETGNVGGDFALDTARLDPQRLPVLLVSIGGHQGFWGGSLDYSLVNIIDVTQQPLLLLKTESLNQNSSYGRVNDSVDDEEASSSEKLEQRVSIRNSVIAVEQPQLTTTNQQGERVINLQPTPATMLSAGRYRYQRGKVFRVGK